MLEFTPTEDDATDGLTVGRGRWIDALLVVAGLLCVGAGWPVVGVPLVGLGVLMPLLRWSGRRRGAPDVWHLVPPNLADSHRGVLTASSLAGVCDPDRVVKAADVALLEVAALLGGRPPRGAAQRRFVAARVAALNDTATELRERHEAWLAATAEVEALAPAVPAEEGGPAPSGLLVRGFVVVLFPVFLVWDLLWSTVHGLVALANGLALRLRIMGRLVVRAGAGVVGLVLGARPVWSHLRHNAVTAAREARYRVTSARVRTRLHMRRARRAMPGSRLGLRNRFRPPQHATWLQ